MKSHEVGCPLCGGSGLYKRECNVCGGRTSVDCVNVVVASLVMMLVSHVARDIGMSLTI